MSDETFQAAIRLRERLGFGGEDVDFYRRGDLFAVVDELNGVS